MTMTERTDAYAAFARLCFPMAGDPPAAELLSKVPGGDALRGLAPESLAREHDRTFGHSLSKDAPAYETSYGAAHIFMQSHELADIAGFYKAFGMDPTGLERPDHLAVELEFMQYLLAKEEYARANAGPEAVEICREGQRAFLRDHLGRWVGAFAARLRGQGASPFYAAVSDELAKFVRGECDAFGVTPSSVSAAELRQPEPDTSPACGPCGFNEFKFPGATT